MKATIYYGSLEDEDEERQRLVFASTSTGPKASSIRDNERPSQANSEVAFLIYSLFELRSASHIAATTNPELPPEQRFKRHRNYYIWLLNEFRHWWKTSRLLVRFSGAMAFIQDDFNWDNMAVLDVTHRRQLKAAAKISKRIGQGGTIRFFLDQIQPFTRLIRFILAVARAIEAHVDNRMLEVGLAEAFAFMGNRCSRYWARQFTDWFTRYAALPFYGVTFAPYIDSKCRPVMITMGLIRAFLPFAVSFQGARFGRQMTYNTYKFAAYRWKSVQGIRRFHEKAGTYQKINVDKNLVELARLVAETLGHFERPKRVRDSLGQIGFKSFGAGNGGHGVFTKIEGPKTYILHITPYGPSINGELPMFVVLERRVQTPGLGSRIQKAAKLPQARLEGFCYSGAYFLSQEWAALKRRYDKEILDYANACRIMKTRAKYIHGVKHPVPPKDLPSLKAFIRSGRPPHKKSRDNSLWQQVHREIENMVNLVHSYQSNGTVPKKVILYLEGLDCAGKSSTGMLICDALSRCGFDVKVAQHNRPPNDQQKQRPWMDRIRFEYPDDMYSGEVPESTAVVWDRGPAGDFVYGNYKELPLEEKLQKYCEFRSYDADCRKNGVLFCKILFVTDKDSIAATLGKRLAHKRIAQDLKSWLDANSSQHYREDIEAIERHIDPTDFIAFNRYDENLTQFADFARNTDDLSDVTSPQDEYPYYVNPWLVVNTSNRHMARLQIIRAFEHQVNRFTLDPKYPTSKFQLFKRYVLRDFVEAVDDPKPQRNLVVEERESPISVRVILQVVILGLLLYFYIYQTWNLQVDLMY